MSKNKYILPMEGLWYVEYGGLTKKTSHSWDIPSQRYAYDFEIRHDNLPYCGDYTKCKNYYSYLQNVIAPLDGWVIDLKNEYNDTRILPGRPIICDVDDPRGNYIVIKHKNNEYSLIAHLKKDSFKVKIGEIVKTGQVLASVGNSGNTQGPHIHYQLQNNYNINNETGIIITFKNVLVNKKNKFKKTKYLTQNSYVQNS